MFIITDWKTKLQAGISVHHACSTSQFFLVVLKKIQHDSLLFLNFVLFFRHYLTLGCPQTHSYLRLALLNTPFLGLLQAWHSESVSVVELNPFRFIVITINIYFCYLNSHN